MIDAVWIGIAFALGFGAKMVGLPPLIGYLAAGFTLFSLGVDPGETIEHFSEMGVTLLLFSIGLKLDPAVLLRPQIWGVASIHMVISSVVISAIVMGLSVLALPLVAGIDWETALIVGFALSFSSTVFAVKVLEQKAEMAAVYGRTAIGILIFQDIAAVLFLAASLGKIPTAWALLVVIGIIPLRYILMWIMDRIGHGELLILFGLAIALGGAQVFDMVSIKGDLGALLLGMLMARHRKSDELAGALLGFKDLFLVGFFLNIGLIGIPGPAAIGIAVLLVALVPLKGVLFFWLLTRFRMRSRTSLLASLSLSNYSEFGLIVAYIAVQSQWLSDEWLTTLAVALSLSFVLASPLNTKAHRLYDTQRQRLRRFQVSKRAPEEREIYPGRVTTLVMGMGRVGTGAYDVFAEHPAERIAGIDLNANKVSQHQAAGRHVLRGSATDADFWSRLHLSHSDLKRVLLAMPSLNENLFATEQLRKNGYQGEIAALAKYEDDIPVLKAAGVDRVFNLYAEAGTGFADHLLRDPDLATGQEPSSEAPG